MSASAAVAVAAASAAADGNGQVPRQQHPRTKEAGGRQRLTVVFKLGTSSICHEVTHRPLLSNLSLVVEAIVELRELGHRVVLVSSGAIATGLRRLNIPAKPKALAQVQALAAIGQGRLMSLYDDLFAQFNTPIAQVLLTKNDLADRTQYFNAVNTLNELLALGVVPIINENDTICAGVGSLSSRRKRVFHEIRFGDNDTLSAITAGMVQADYLFLLTDVDCLYTDNPRTCPDAKPIGDVQDLDALRNKVTVTTPGSSLGTGGMVTKLIAADLATAAGVTTVISNGSFPRRALAILAAGHPELFQPSMARSSFNFSSEPESTVPEGCDSPIIGKVTPFGTVQLHTRVLPKPHTLVDRTWWVMHGLHDAGALVVDENSVTASVRHRSALFSSGVLRVDGQFAANQAVKVYVERKAGTEVERVLVGKGLVNYTSTEIELIKGRDPSEISDLLGYGDAESVIHRENFAIVLRPEDTVY